MRDTSTLGQSRARLPVAPVVAVPAPAVPISTVKEIPYDFAVRFLLKGEESQRQQQILSIGAEGAFVALAIGYSFIPVIPAPPPAPLPEPPPDDGGVDIQIANFSDPALLADLRELVQCLLVRVCGIDFLYSMIDSTTGRELQNIFIHNLAGLGEPNGHRPFRPLAKPILFLPQSTIRIEIEEISKGPRYAGAKLFIVLHGYKILGYVAGSA